MVKSFCYYVKSGKGAALIREEIETPARVTSRAGFYNFYDYVFGESPYSYLNTRPAAYDMQLRREENVKRLLPRFSSRRRSVRLPRRNDYLIKQPNFVFNMSKAKKPRF